MHAQLQRWMKIDEQWECRISCATKMKARTPGEGSTRVTHGRSGMTMDPRIPAAPGRSTSGFHRIGRPCLHQARSAKRCWASRMKGELHPTKNSFLGGRSCIWMTASNALIYFLVWPLPETAMGIPCNCLVGALPYMVHTA